nr:probable prolyl 4-hydroxylase 3 [Quercus suber]XP_023892477.1 probable prolyl 4-hydroxylase 3 [Quercus suber]
MGKGRSRGQKWTQAFFMLSLLLLLLMLFTLGILSLSNSTDGSPRSEGFGERVEQWTETLSWEPRVFIYHNFLSKEECEHIISLAKPHMRKSTIVDSKSGRGIESRVRTSFGMFLHRGQDKIIRDLERRIADFTLIPVEHGEGLQVLHYEVGQKYEPHFDFFHNELYTRNGGQRLATLLMYLSDVEEGGETVFPAANQNFSSVPWWDELSECGKKGLSVKPKMGDALLFWNMSPNGKLDPLSLHGSCPVIRGDKWSSTKWMRIEEFKV